MYVDNYLKFTNSTLHVFQPEEKDITKLSTPEIMEFRKEVQIIFQDPFSSLNPRITIGAAIQEPMKVHKILQTEHERRMYVVELLEKVGLLEEHYHRSHLNLIRYL